MSRGDLQIAISTAGESPAVAQRLRREIDEQLSTDLGPWLTELGQLRREILATLPAGEDAQSSAASTGRTPVLRIKPAQFFVPTGHPERQEGLPRRRWSRRSRPAHSQGTAADPIGRRNSARRPGPASHSRVGRRNAEIVNVGKRCGTKSITQEEIHALMIEHAEAGSRVVRLKSGDPLIFGRAAEEMAALALGRSSFRSSAGHHGCLCRCGGNSLLAHRSQCGVKRDLFDRPSRAIAQSRAGSRTRRCYSRCLHAGSRSEPACAGMARRKACRPISPAPSCPTPRSRTSRSSAPRLRELGKARPTQSPSLLIAGWAVRETADNRIEAIRGTVLTM